MHYEGLDGEDQMWHLQKTQLIEKERDIGSKLPESTIDISLDNLFGGRADSLCGKVHPRLCAQLFPALLKLLNA